MDALLAQTPVVGVNVYEVVTVLSGAGDHVPVIPLLEVVGNGDKASPEHIAATCVNKGVTGMITVMVIVVLVAQGPGTGVNV
jgi:hypothetical protein